MLCKCFSALQLFKESKTCINANPEEIIFTSGGTESDNWAIKNFTVYDAERHIYTSAIEHHAVLNACKSFIPYSDVQIIPVDQYGVATPDKLKCLLSKPTEHLAVPSCIERSLVSVMLANNEIGTIQPIKELVKVAHSYEALFHTDAVQALGHIPVDVKDLDVDMLSASAHKFNGPKGIGFLYCKNRNELHPLHNGGSQEFELRAGTENIPAIVGMAVALRNNVKNMKENETHCLKLSSIFIDKMRSSNIDFILNGHEVNRLPGNINISIRGKSGEALMHLLDLKGIFVSTGSACDSVNQQVSHVIRAINVPSEYAEGTLRITFGKDNKIEDAEMIADTIITLIKK